jgi:hypothetical protein
MDEFDFDGRGMGGGGSRFGGGGSRFGGGGGAAAAPVDDASVVGLIAPIEIFIRGNNQSIIEFMHSVTNSRNPMEIDRVRLRNIRPQDGLMEAQLFINVIAYANYVGATNAQDVERIIVETRRSLAEISMSVGARDLAEADGLVVVRDGRYELATPSPTPHPATQAAQPVVVVDEFDDFR